MPWWEKLKGILVDINLPKLEKVCLIDNSINVNPTIRMEGSKTLVVTNPQLLKGSKKDAIEEITKHFYEIKDEFVNKKTEVILYQAKTNIKSAPNHAISIFFKDRVSTQDFSLIGSCLYLKSIYEQGNSILCATLKNQIILRYGNKGSIVSNLCTAGYLEDNIIPTLAAMDKPRKMDYDTFQKAFDELIFDFPIAVFVNHLMNEQEVEMMIKNRIIRNKKYDINQLSIHGINNKNINVINKIVEKLTKETLIKKRSQKRTGSAIKVTVFF